MVFYRILPLRQVRVIFRNTLVAMLVLAKIEKLIFTIVAGYWQPSDLLTWSSAYSILNSTQFLSFSRISVVDRVTGVTYKFAVLVSLGGAWLERLFYQNLLCQKWIWMRFLLFPVTRKRWNVTGRKTKMRRRAYRMKMIWIRTTMSFRYCVSALRFASYFHWHSL